MKNLYDELMLMKINLGLIEKAYYKKDDEIKFREMEKSKQPLPNDVKFDTIGYYKYVDTNLSADEINELLLYRKLSYLKTIKNILSFFTVLTLISMLFFFFNL